MSDCLHIMSCGGETPRPKTNRDRREIETFVLNLHYKQAGSYYPILFLYLFALYNMPSDIPTYTRSPVQDSR